MMTVASVHFSKFICVLRLYMYTQNFTSSLDLAVYGGLTDLNLISDWALIMFVVSSPDTLTCVVPTESRNRVRTG